MAIGLQADKVDEYLKPHENVWPEVDTMIGRCSIRNMTIFIHRLIDGKHYLPCI